LIFRRQTVDEQLAAALAAKGFRRPIDVQEDYYAKGQPDGSEDYYIRVLTREESERGVGGHVLGFGLEFLV